MRRPGILDFLCLLLVTGWGLILLLPQLGHPSLHNWDEAMHQAATRGVHATFFVPHIFRDPLWPVPHSDWWNAHIWLHKPTGAFWLGALAMKVLGVTPLALRSVSLLAQLCAACALFVFIRPLTGRLAATVAALGFLALPFGWLLTQGYMFGDVTDTTLAAFVVTAMVLLVRTVETGSWKLAVAAGVAVGLGYLCKTALALTPLGVALSLAVLGRLGFLQAKLPFRLVLWMALAAAAVGAPWNLYSSHQWPELYAFEADTTWKHLFTDEMRPWIRPPDGLLNEINETEAQPLPVVLPALAWLWCLVRALRDRQPRVVALALWLSATWFVLSVARAKVPATAWGAVPGLFAALALLFQDARRTPALAAATLAGLATPWAVKAWPALAALRQALPAALVQTRARPGLAEGVVLAALAAALAFALLLAVRRWERGRRWLGAGLGLCAAVALAFALVPEAAAATARFAREKADVGRISYTAEVGRAVDAAVPERAVFFQPFDRDPPCCFEWLSHIFWSGRMTYRRAPDVARAQERGYHPYLLSPQAEPYQPVPGVPAHAWLRAYDLLAPAPPPGLPEGARPLDVRTGGLTVLAYAAGPIDREKDRWTFFVRSDEAPHELTVTFHTAKGKTRVTVKPEDSLHGRHRLRGAAWFVMPALGPRLERVESLELGSPPVRVVVGGS